MDLELKGLHHLTAITAQVGANRRFYTETLGLRLVETTVNQDDTSAYHLFYADGEGRPGSDITFFDWPAAPERRGTSAIVRTGFRVAGEDGIEWWRGRLRDLGIAAPEPAERNGCLTLPFEDSEGQRLMLVHDDERGPASVWQRSPVPPARQILGLGPVVVSVPNLQGIRSLLIEGLNMQEAGTYAETDGADVHVFAMGAGGPAAELHVAVQASLSVARPGAGGAHHVAFRTPDREQLRAWVTRLSQFGTPTSGEIERYYFRSLYFREPNGILFEIATDGPGFAVDEPADALGEKLSLPPFLEPQRADIEARLKPL